MDAMMHDMYRDETDARSIELPGHGEAWDTFWAAEDAGPEPRSDVRSSFRTFETARVGTLEMAPFDSTVLPEYLAGDLRCNVRARIVNGRYLRLATLEVPVLRYVVYGADVDTVLGDLIVSDERDASDLLLGYPVQAYLHSDWLSCFTLSLSARHADDGMGTAEQAA